MRNNTSPFHNDSHELTEVIGALPTWPMKWGTLTICFLVASILILSWFIKFPIRVAGSVVVTTLNPPYKVISKSNGKLVKLSVSDSDMVSEGDILAIIDNTSDASDIFLLKQQLDSLERDRTFAIKNEFIQSAKLGEIQDESRDLNTAVSALKSFVIHDPISKQIAGLIKQIDATKNLCAQQKNQSELAKQKHKLISTDYERDRKLFRENAISAKDLEAKQLAVLSASTEFETTQLNVAQTLLRLSELEQALVDKRIQLESEKRGIDLAIEETSKKVKNAIALWEEKYVLKTPISGRVTFFNFLSTEQVIRDGEEVMIVVPVNQEKLIGRVLIPIANSGKVKMGQRVNVYLDNYPYDEYGKITGIVNSISLVPREKFYAVTIIFPNRLLTSYGLEIKFAQELQGRAEIITEDVRLMQRIFYQFYKLSEI